MGGEGFGMVLVCSMQEPPFLTFLPLLLSEIEIKPFDFRIPVGCYAFFSLPCSGTPNCSPLDPIRVLSPSKTVKEWSGYPDQRPAGALIAHNHEELSGSYRHVLAFIKH